MLFIIWDPKDGMPDRDHNGNIISSGCFGCITEDNVYLTSYASYPNMKRPSDLNVGERLDGVKYSLSGSKGIYTIFRVQ